MYSKVRNSSTGGNKHTGGNFSQKNKHTGRNKRTGGNFHKKAYPLNQGICFIVLGF